jgi:glycosyltransferase involved in cell wall biosynthesis
MIIHVSNDFPDNINPAKTHAVKNLLEISSGVFEHFVYSLNRRSPDLTQLVGAAARNPLSPALPIMTGAETNMIVPISYDAPPFGLYLRSGLDRVADWISNDIERRGLRPLIIHGHKLTIEGIVAAKVAARLGLPYALSIHGNTDTKILKARPDIKSLYRRVFHEARVAFFVAPWIQDYIETSLGQRKRATHVLPVPTFADRLIPPKIVGPRLITAFHLDNYRSKNAKRLIKAVERLRLEIEGVELSIVGGGTSSARQSLEALTERGPVRLEGAIPHDLIQARMNTAGAFVLVSKRESFGMVFIEALLAGCPVVYPKGRAIDGYFDDCPFAIPAAPDDQAAITAAVRELVTKEAQLKSALREWQQSEGPRRFEHAAIAEVYVAAMQGAVRKEPP